MLNSTILWLLTSETVKSAALSLQSVDDIKGDHSLSASMFGEVDCVSDHVLNEYLKGRTGLFIDKSRNSLNTASASKTTNVTLTNALDVIS